MDGHAAGVAAAYPLGHDRPFGAVSLCAEPRDGALALGVAGAIIATLLWITGSVGFSVYVTHFNSYDKTYGSLGGVVIMLTWLYLSAFAALFGAIINAQASGRRLRIQPSGTRSRWATGAPMPPTRLAKRAIMP